MLGKIEGGRRRGWQRMRWLDGITDSVYIYIVVSSRTLQSLGFCGPFMKTMANEQDPERCQLP